MKRELSNIAKQRILTRLLPQLAAIIPITIATAISVYQYLNLAANASEFKQNGTTFLAISTAILFLLTIQSLTAHHSQLTEFNGHSDSTPVQKEKFTLFGAFVKHLWAAVAFAVSVMITVISGPVVQIVALMIGSVLLIAEGFVYTYFRNIANDNESGGIFLWFMFGMPVALLGLLGYILWLTKT